MFLFQLNVDSLLGQELPFTKKTNTILKIGGGRAYEAAVTKKKSSLNLLLPNKKGKVSPGKTWTKFEQWQLGCEFSSH